MEQSGGYLVPNVIIGIIDADTEDYIDFDNNVPVHENTQHSTNTDDDYLDIQGEARTSSTRVYSSILDNTRRELSLMPCEARTSSTHVYSSILDNPSELSLMPYPLSSSFSGNAVRSGSSVNKKLVWKKRFVLLLTKSIVTLVIAFGLAAYSILKKGNPGENGTNGNNAEMKTIEETHNSPAPTRKLVYSYMPCSYCDFVEASSVCSSEGSCVAVIENNRIKKTIQKILRKNLDTRRKFSLVWVLKQKFNAHSPTEFSSVSRNRYGALLLPTGLFLNTIRYNYQTDNEPSLIDIQGVICEKVQSSRVDEGPDCW